MNEFVAADDARYDERERQLILVGNECIAVANDRKLDEYFADGYRFSGPDGSMTYEQVKAFFSSMRAAFRDFRCERREVISEGTLIAARTSMSGIFDNIFNSALLGPIRPHGRPVSFELMNFFRYTPEGKLIEEWVQYDNIHFLKQLGIDLVELYKRPD